MRILALSLYGTNRRKLMHMEKWDVKKSFFLCGSCTRYTTSTGNGENTSGPVNAPSLSLTLHCTDEVDTAVIF
jgi:hypothetical protein